MSNALVNTEFADERTGQREVDILTVVSDGDDLGKFFYDTGKHAGRLLFSIYQFIC